MTDDTSIWPEIEARIAIDEDGKPLPDCKIRMANGGFTIRDWFAGQALLGYLAAPPREAHGESILDDRSPDRLAHFAYRTADAMMEERNHDRS
jgi:hypothetical protein